MYESGFVMFHETPKTIIGKIITLIEVLGLNPNQEKATKDLIKQAVWDTIDNQCLFINAETHSKIRDDYNKQRRLNELKFEKEQELLNNLEK